MSKFSHDAAADDDATARQYLDVFFENSRAKNVQEGAGPFHTLMMSDI